MIDKIDNYRLIRTFSSIDFSVTPFKIDQIKIQNRSTDLDPNLRNERGGKKMQRPAQRFLSEEYFVYEIFEEMFYPNL